MAGSRPRPIVPKSLSEAYRIAQAVCAAKMAPKGLETPEACMIAIMHGLEVGLSPLAALQRIAVINGRPTIWGDGALALVRASGLCEAIEEWIEGDRPETWVAVCNVIRRDDPIPVERRFSTEDAKRARLWGKAGPWSDYPKRMLQMRARAFALRDAFPDVLGGLYLTEELLSGVERDLQPSTGDVFHSVRQANLNEQDLDPSHRSHTNIRSDARTGAGVGAFVSEDDLENRENAPESSNAAVQRQYDQHPTPEGPLDGGDDELRERQANCGRSVAPSSLVRQPRSPAKPPHHDVDPSGVSSAFVAPASIPPDHVSVRTNDAHGSITETHSALPSLANLRRARSMPREVRALRFRNQWSVRQPRGPKTNPSKPVHAGGTVDASRNQAAHSPASLTSQQDTADHRIKTHQDETTRQQAPLTSPTNIPGRETTPPADSFVPPDDIAAHLDLYDAALCCAADPETLSEIAEEFLDRLSQLPIQARQKAELIFEQHQQRVLRPLHQVGKAHE